MSNHPVLLAVRFLLELAGLYALGYWGWTQHTGAGRYLWAIGLPLLAAVLWGTFRVPGDPGDAPLAVPGAVRLLLEAAFFGGAVWALAATGRGNWAFALAVIVLVLYALSYDQIVWMLQARSPRG